MISSMCSAQASMCCWRPPLWPMQPVTPTSHRRTTEHAAHRKTSSPSLSTWQVQRGKKEAFRQCWRVQELLHAWTLTHTIYTHTPMTFRQKLPQFLIFCPIAKEHWIVKWKGEMGICEQRQFSLSFISVAKNLLTWSTHCNFGFS